MEVANGLATAQPDLGWVHERDLAPWLESAVRPLQAGGLSPVDREPFGCVFVQLVERREVQPISYDQAKRAIQNQLFQQRMQGEYAKFIEDLGADSLDTVELVMALEEHFDIQIPDEDAEKIVTVGDAIQYIKDNS